MNALGKNGFSNANMLSLPFLSYPLKVLSLKETGVNNKANMSIVQAVDHVSAVPRPLSSFCFFESIFRYC